ncbi:MAG: hypothetical protein KDD42_01835, partial [Bdellovibrionales bacterium]|nr:hypothetical protein [Bdellovibrionales bacterium]
YDPFTQPGAASMYDRRGRLLKSTSTSGKETFYSYAISAIDLPDEGQLKLRSTTKLAPNGGIRSYSYDAAGALRRTAELNAPSLYLSHYYYNADLNLVRYRDNLGNITNWKYDSFGQKIATEESNLSNCADGSENCPWTSIYDDQGFVREQTDASGSTVRMHYDYSGRLVCRDTANLVSDGEDCDCRQLDEDTVDPNPHKALIVGFKDSCYYYDDTPPGDGEVSPRSGSLVTVVDSSGIARFDYDVQGNVSLEDKWICIDLNAHPNSTNIVCRHLVTEMEYDVSGVPLELTLTDTESNQHRVTYEYDSQMRLSSISLDGQPQIQNIGYNDRDGLSEVSSQRYVLNDAKILRQNYRYYDRSHPETPGKPSFRLRSHETAVLGGAQVINLEYSQYDDVGNIKTMLRKERISGRPLPVMMAEIEGGGGYAYTGTSWTYSYDAINRLTQAQYRSSLNTTLEPEEVFNYQYSSLGNLEEFTHVDYSTGTPRERIKNYYYGAIGEGAGGVHALTEDSEGTIYDYDANGNLISDGSQDYVYDERRRLKATHQNDLLLSQIFYDGSDQKIAEVLYNPCNPAQTNGCNTSALRAEGAQWYFNSRYFETLSANGTRKKRMRLNGSIEINLENPRDKRVYITDHLSSVVAIVSGDGEVVDSREYDPFGNLRAGNLATTQRYGFNGTGFDSESGLYDYGARHLDPEMGRFIMADTVIPNVTDSQSFNRYSYVRNNPPNAIDLDGHSDHITITAEDEYGGENGYGWYSWYDGTIESILVDIWADRPKYSTDGIQFVAVGRGRGGITSGGGSSGRGGLIGGIFTWWSKTKRIFNEALNSPLPGSYNSRGEIENDMVAPSLLYMGMQASSAPMDAVREMIVETSGMSENQAMAAEVVFSVALRKPSKNLVVRGAKEALEETTETAANKARMAAVRAAGDAGQRQSPWIHNKTARIPSVRGPGRYHIPDGIGPDFIGETKNVSGTLGLTPQMRSYIKYARDNGVVFRLHTRENTRFSGPLARELDSLYNDGLFEHVWPPIK